MVTKTPRSRRPRTAAQGIVIKEQLPLSTEDGKKAFAALQKDLICRLEHLRVEANQVCEAYLANLDGEINTLIDFLEGTSEVRRPADLKAATMKTWSAALEGVGLKPAKGRRKDLRRVDETIKALMKSAFE